MSELACPDPVKPSDPVESGCDEAVDSTVTSTGPPNANMTLTSDLDDDIAGCKPCNLVFNSKDCLSDHETNSEYHKMACTGFNPSVGKHFCFLCWKGFRFKKGLLEHYNGIHHEEQVKKHNVKAIWFTPTLSDDENEDASVPSPKRQRTSSQSSSTTKTTGGASAAATERVPECRMCNLVFSCDRSETLHRESERHGAVRANRKPRAPSGRKDAGIDCLLCWVAFDKYPELFRHYESDEHLTRMTRYGVKQLLKDERETVDVRPPIDIKDFIVLDEIGQDDTQPDQTEKAIEETETAVGTTDANGDAQE